MAQRKTICAFTALGNTYPEYLNISQKGDDVEITLREKASNDGKEGKVSFVTIPAAFFALVLEDANKNFKR